MKAAMEKQIAENKADMEKLRKTLWVLEREVKDLTRIGEEKKEAISKASNQKPDAALILGLPMEGDRDAGGYLTRDMPNC